MEGIIQDTRCCEVYIFRKIMPNGALCVRVVDKSGVVIIEQYEHIEKKPVTGKKSRYCFGERFRELTPEQMSVLHSLTVHMARDGRIKSRKRSKRTRKAEFLSFLAAGKTKAYEMYNELTKIGAIYEKDGSFYVHRSFIFRG